MPTVLLAYGCRFQICTRDHPPAHVHIVRGRAHVTMAKHTTEDTILLPIDSARIAEIKKERAKINAALRRGAARLKDVRFQADPRGIDVMLKNGMRVFIPLAALGLPALNRASDDALEHLEFYDDACGSISWPDLDEDVSLTGFLAEIFRETLRAEFNRSAGKATSPKKAAAARRNGRKGGRPKSTAAQRAKR